MTKCDPSATDLPIGERAPGFWPGVVVSGDHHIGKLKALGARLKPAAGRIASVHQTRDQAREAAKPWRKWYRIARWRSLRERVLAEAGYRCEQTGVLLVGAANAPNSPVVDHVRPHRGDPTLFWDRSNLQAVSKEWHDREKQRIEARRGVGPSSGEVRCVPA